MNVLEQLPKGASVVVIRLRSLGDAVLMTPALMLLKRTRPDLRLSVALERALAGLLDGLPEVDRVLAVDRRRRWEAIRAVRRERPRLCLNLHVGSTSAWMTAFSGARFRAGYGHFGKRFVYNVKIPRAQQILGRAADAAVHTAEHHASAIFALGAERVEVPPARLAAEPLSRGKPYAVLHVAAGYETKRWAAERFAAAARMLRQRHGLEPVVIAGPGEDELLDLFREFETKPALSVAELKSLLAGASLFLGNDSGPAHVAAAFGKPCVVVFGSSNSAVWRPWKTRCEVVETEWDCKPCPGDRCYAFEAPRCILSVRVDAVERAVERVLSR